MSRAQRMPRAAREEQLLGIAERVFGERGFQAATVEEIAEAAGVTKPVVYDLFGSKEGLLAAGVARARGELQDAVRAAWRTVPRDAPAESSFRAGVRAFFDFMDEHASAWTLLQQEGVFAAGAARPLEEFRAGNVDLVLGALRRSAPPEVSDVALEGMVEALIGACERVAVWRTRRTVPAQQATDLVVALTWQGLRAVVTDRG